MVETDLCHICRTSLAEDDQDDQYMSRRADHHQSYDTFVDSKESGCVLCCWVWTNHSLPSPNDVTGQFSASLFYVPKAYISVEVTCSWTQPTTHFFYVRSSLDLQLEPWLGIDPLIGSPQSLEKIARWMSDCDNGHQSCHALKSESFFPTRAIDVGNIDKGTVQLVDREAAIKDHLGAEHPYPPYMTLSHRWGDPKKITQLLGSNKARFVIGIRIDELTPTFRDAMMLAHRLGERYIWVDSLCIIQDSPQDWEQEAVQMSNVYGNSLCNIAAVSSSYDLSRGLFARRVLNPRLFYPFSVERRIPQKDHTEFTSYWSRWNWSMWKLEIEQTPLSTRGWILQERVLSPRTVYFTQNQLYWQCLHHIRCETDPDGSLGLLDDSRHARLSMSARRLFGEAVSCQNQLRAQLALRQKKPDQGLELNSELEKQINILKVDRDRLRPGMRDYWWTIVEAFSQCQLTKESDKLIAIAGIARKFQQMYPDLYLVGLWKDSLHLDLGWCAVDAEGKRNESFATTWTWASISGSIVRIIPTGMELRDLKDQISSSNIRFMGARIEPANVGGDTMGLLNCAELDIECWLARFKWSSHRVPEPVTSEINISIYAEQPVFQRHTTNELVTPIDSWESCRLFDTQERTQKSERDGVVEGYCIPLSTYSFRGGGVCLFLLLEKVSGSTFKRMGVHRIYYNDETWPGGPPAADTIITLV